MTGRNFFDTAGAELASMQIGEALQLYRFAEKAGHDPDECAAGRWNCHMLAGNFELAWRESDAIAQRGNPDPHRFWDGRPFQGRRVMLRCLHGLGDTLQFVRYAPLIRQQAKSVTIEAQPKLKHLLEQAHLADRVITWGKPDWGEPDWGEPECMGTEPPWDQQVEVMELPRIFRTTIDSIPERVPYITVPPDSLARQDDPCGLLRVGVVWASSHYNPARSVAVERMAPLFETPGVSFVSLQAGPEARDIEPWSGQVTILPDEFTGIFHTAKAIQSLDLVITVDTMTAHLAGAMGRPVWTLLPYECDWRWMLARADSPWYPTMRLFRQRNAGDWNPVIDAVQRELTALAACPPLLHSDAAPQPAGILVPEP